MSSVSTPRCLSLWTGPSPTSFPLCDLSFLERLEQHLRFLARCEHCSIRIRGWSQDEHIPDRISQLDPKEKSDYNGVNYVRAFPCKIFSRCKSIIRGECILFSGKIPVGLIRALVQKVEAYQPLGIEPPPISWWRDRLEQDPRERYRTYRISSDFRLDVQTPYGKVSAKTRRPDKPTSPTQSSGA